MKFLAKEGGGMVFDLDPASAAAQIVSAVRSQCVLQFTAANPARNGKAHKLEVRLTIKDVEIHALPAYFAPENNGHAHLSRDASLSSELRHSA